MAFMVDFRFWKRVRRMSDSDFNRFMLSFITLVFFGFISAVVVQLFSISYSWKTTSVFFGVWLTLWPFLFEKINKTKVVISGDIVPSRERILLIANHRTEVDWMYL
jgi:lysocardiolipin and lysophospholipid acyltransferase